MKITHIFILSTALFCFSNMMLASERHAPRPTTICEKVTGGLLFAACAIVYETSERSHPSLRCKACDNNKPNGLVTLGFISASAGLLASAVQQTGFMARTKDKSE